VSRPRNDNPPLRNDLVREAAALIGERGLYGFSMRAVARRLGVSHNAASYYFSSKESVVVAVATRGFEMLASQLTAARYPPAAELGRAEASPDVEMLTRLGMAYYRFAVQHANYFSVMFGEFLADLDSPDAAFVSANQRAIEALFQPVRTVYPTAAPHELRDHALYLWSHVHGITHLQIDGPLRFRLEPQEDAETVVESQIRACARRLLASTS